MKKWLVAGMLPLFVGQLATAQINLGKITQKVGTITGTSLSESDITTGLKEALRVGANNASAQLHKPDGFFKDPLVKIPFPEDARRVATKLREMGMGSKVDQFELTLNRAAEGAAKEAAPIFVNAITSMTITDAKNILTGNNDAATVYLREKTSSQLASAFAPHIRKALDSTLATRLWRELTATYNKLPLVRKVNTDLTQYTTDKALKGLFTVVAAEELKIRQDPAARISEILKKVFAK